MYQELARDIQPFLQFVNFKRCFPLSTVGFGLCFIILKSNNETLFRARIKTQVNYLQIQLSFLSPMGKSVEPRTIFSYLLSFAPIRIMQDRFLRYFHNIDLSNVFL